VTAGCIAVLILNGLAARTLAAPGDLDPTFSRDGKAMFWFPGTAWAVAVEPDGQIVIAGPPSYDSDWNDFLLQRLRADGTLDRSFGDRGLVKTDFDHSPDEVWALAVEPDGKVVAAGGSSGDFAVARYLPNGTLDDSFSQDGLARPSFNGRANDVAVQPNGKIVVAGYGYAAGGSGPDFELARFNGSGTLDDSFGDHGKVSLDLAGRDIAWGVALQADGRLVAAGDAGRGLGIARLLPDGTPDPSFSDDGIVTARYAADGDGARDVALQPDGKILVVAYGYLPAPTYDRRRVIELARYRSGGELDSTFSGGVVSTLIGSGVFPRALGLEPDGKIVVAGEGDGFELARYEGDGALDTTFGYGGTLRTDFWVLPYLYGLVPGAESLAIQPDGKIVAVGGTDYPERSAIARYLVAQGPRDADADGVGDGLDPCPSRFGSNTGCPHFRRRVSIQYFREYDEFRGRLSSPAFDCLREQRVAVFRKRPGPDRRIGRDLTGTHGAWEVSRYKPRGRYFARINERMDSSLGVCEADRSRIVAFRR
jgi:uncharacterized delta-60 repeat protein